MPKDNKVKKEKKHFFRDFKAELKKVIWPTPKQLINNTIAVITIVLITAAVVFALDFVFENMNKYGIKKLLKAINKKKTQKEKMQTKKMQKTLKITAKQKMEQKTIQQKQKIKK